jgi:serine/threonine protein kinase
LDSKTSYNLDFIVLKMLGQGAFGKVYLVKKKETENLYAMKIIKMK